MRIVDLIALHCTATKPGQHVNRDVVDQWHKARGWKGIGYHYLVLPDGKIEIGRTIDKIGAHAYGFNRNSIGVCWVGGLDKDGNPTDNRTEAQKRTLKYLVQNLRNVFPDAEVLGHRDLSPDIDGDGVIEPWEFIKACPCFDAKKEFA